jgi:hypothetical protein
MYLSGTDPNRSYGPSGQPGTCMYGPQNADGTCPGPSFFQANPTIATVVGTAIGPYGSFAVIFAIYWLFIRKK